MPPACYRLQVLPGGITRLAASAPPGELEAVHRALVAALEPPLKLLYVRLTDRASGQLPKPEHLVAVGLSRDRVLDALARFRRLIYHDGRNQVWVRGARTDQVVLEEIGAIYVYPDDPLFRDVLEDCGLVESDQGETMADRDYVKVNFLAEADAEEAALIADLGLVRWEG